MARRPAPGDKRLSKEAQEIVYTRLIAGASNAEVRQALHDAGHLSDLDHSTIYHYRKTKRVRDGIALASHEDYQSGHGPAPRRVAACKYLLTYCLDAIAEGVLVEVDVPEERNAEGELIRGTATIPSFSGHKHI